MDPNSMLVCCLLYLGCITSPNTYTSCEIKLLEQSHHSQIVAIESDPPTLSMVESEYGSAEEEIDIVPVIGCE